ncbi:hypothetical protein Ahia01_001348100 [Argonauta hians]
MPLIRLPFLSKYGLYAERQLSNLIKEQGKTHRINVSTPNRKVLQVTDKFVENYNKVKRPEEQPKYDALAIQMLNRIKHTLGLANIGKKKPIDVNLVWSELILLLKCRGPIEQKCLDVLMWSLKNAVPDYNHVPHLWQLADCLIASFTAPQSAKQQSTFLKGSHMKQLRACHLVFVRLYLHKMTNHLNGWQEMKKRLLPYFTTDLPQLEQIYTKHPDALLLFKFIVQVADIVLVCEEDNNKVRNGASYLCEATILPPILPTKKDIELSAYELCCPSQTNSWISQCMHQLSSPLWHALNVWKCQTMYLGDEMVRDTANKKKQMLFLNSLTSLIKCPSKQDSTSW